MRFPAVFLLVLSAFAVEAWGGQLRQIALLDIPGRPGFDQVAFAHGMLIMAHSAGNTLDIFDPARRRIVQQVAGMSGPHGLAVDARRNKVYVANSSGKNIAIVSATDWKVERTIPLSLAPYELALSPDGKRLLIGNWENRSISAVNLAAADQITTQDLNGSPAGLAWDNERQLVFVSLQDTAEVAAIDSRSLRVVNRYKLLASQPTAILFDQQAQRLYVAIRHAVLSLDADTGQELGRVAAPAGADSLWLDSSTGTLYAAAGGGYIDVYRTGDVNLTAIDEIHTEVRGQKLAFDPVRKFLFFPGGREGRSKLLILKQLAPTPGATAESQVAIK